MRFLTGKDRIEFERLLGEVSWAKSKATLLDSNCESMRASIKRLVGERDHERQRAENATDELLAMRGIAPISVPPEPRDLGDGDPFAEDPGEVAKLEKRMQEQGIGAVLMEPGKG